MSNQNEATDTKTPHDTGGSAVDADVSETPSVTITFPSEEQRDSFLAWLSDGGGEQQFFDSSKWHDAEPITRMDYSKAFPAWGYDNKRDGQPVVVASC